MTVKLRDVESTRMHEGSCRENFEYQSVDKEHYDSFNEDFKILLGKILFSSSFYISG